jgi:hypothetical protein
MYSFTSCSRIFHLYGDVTIAGEGLQNLGLCSALRAFEQGGIFIVTHLCDTGPRFFGLIRRNAPFSHLLRHMRGCGGSILTRILMSKIKSMINTFSHGCNSLCLTHVNKQVVVRQHDMTTKNI